MNLESFFFFVANGDEDITHQSRIVKLTIRVGLLPFTKFAPFSVPDIIHSSLQNTTIDSGVRWISQVMKYIARLQPNAQAQLQKIKDSIGFRHPLAW